MIKAILIIILSIPSIGMGQIPLPAFVDLAYSNSTSAKIYHIQQKLDSINYFSNAHEYSPSLKFTISPQYSKSITPVTQPDGTLKNLNVHNLSIGPSLSANIPILPTGGTINLSDSWNYYRNINGKNSYTSFTGNILHITISQPLSFFSNSKWGKRNAKATFEKGNAENAQRYLKIKSTATSLYFRYLLLCESIKNTTNSIEVTESILSKLNLLYSSGKILKSEVLEAQLYILNKRRQLNVSLIEKDFVGKSITMESGLADPAQYISLSNIPEFPLIPTETDYMLDKLHQKQEYLSHISNIGYQYSIAESKNNKKILPTMQIGLGYNGTGESLPEVWDKRRLSYNVGFSLSIPISDIKENDNKLTIARLTYNQKLDHEHEANQKEELQLIKSLKLLGEDYNNYKICLTTDSLYKEELVIAEKLLTSGKILFDDYVKYQNKYLENSHRIIEVIESAYKRLIEIESLLLFNLSTNSFYINL